jgi:uncharacterized protein (TIGR03435 family)
MTVLVRSKGLTCIAVLSALALFLIVGSAASSGQMPVSTISQGDAPAAFDTFMIYPVSPEQYPQGGGFLWWPGHNGWTMSDAPLLNEIAGAYGLGIGQIIGFPGWVETDRYDLFATMDADKFEAFKKLPMDEQVKQRHLMMQASLASRCQLKAHRETREMPVYELVVAKGGLRRILEKDPGDESLFFFSGGWWHTGTMENLASNLAGPSGRIVVDKTGLGSRRYFNALNWASDGKGDTAGGGPSIFKAIEEQLGLELVPATEKVEVLVIDHIEKPTAGGWPAPGSKLAH